MCTDADPPPTQDDTPGTVYAVAEGRNRVHTFFRANAPAQRGMYLQLRLVQLRLTTPSALAGPTRVLRGFRLAHFVVVYASLLSRRPRVRSGPGRELSAARLVPV